jgi:hypothetical protein
MVTDIVWLQWENDSFIVGVTTTYALRVMCNTALTPLLNNILVMSWQSVSLVEETRVIGESHQICHNSLTNLII